MLSHLRIKNFGLIDELEISFIKGLNVLTGETGAGKSMIIEAINVILGGDINQNLIRDNDDFLEVEALFLLDSFTLKRFQNIQEISDLLNEDEQLIIRRQVHLKKKNKCWVNNHIVNLLLLQKVGDYLVDIHGQHSHQSLLNRENHIDFVDHFGTPEFTKTKKEYSLAYSDWQSKNKRLKQLIQNREENQNKQDYLAFQFREIDSAQLKVDEDNQLEERVNIIQHTVKIKEIMEMAIQYLFEGTEEGVPLRDSLAKIITKLNDISVLDEKIKQIKERLTEVQYRIEDIADQIINYKDRIDFDADQLNEYEDRLNLINRLKQKYRLNLVEIIQLKEKLEEQLHRIEDDKESIDQLRKEIELQEIELFRLSRELSKERKKISSQLEYDLIEELKELKMKGCHFVIQQKQIKDQTGIKMDSETYRITSKGIDDIEFLISTNIGEKEKPLQEIVSGGEVSRIMLALKSIFSQIDKIPVMIFDEIDSGVGARLGEVIASKLSKISKNHQVIAVTHLPQIACHADQHLYIYKIVEGERTMIDIRRLENEERIEEIARMLDGEKYGSISLEHAKEMLNQGKDAVNVGKGSEGE